MFCYHHSSLIRVSSCWSWLATCNRYTSNLIPSLHQTVRLFTISPEMHINRAARWIITMLGCWLSASISPNKSRRVAARIRKRERTLLSSLLSLGMSRGCRYAVVHVAARYINDFDSWCNSRRPGCWVRSIAHTCIEIFRNIVTLDTLRKFSIIKRLCYKLLLQKSARMFKNVLNVNF